MTELRDDKQRDRRRWSFVLGAVLASFIVACGPRAGVVADTVPSTRRSEARRHVELVAYLGVEHIATPRYSCTMLRDRIAAADPELVLWPTDESTLDAAAACGQDSECVRQLWANQWPEPCRVVVSDIDADIVPYLEMSDASRAARDAWELANPFGPRSRDYVFASAALMQRQVEQDGPTEAWVHSPEYAVLTRQVSLYRSFAAELDMGAGGELHVLNRMTVAIEEGLALAEARRVVVLVPPASRYYVFQALSNDRTWTVSPPLSGLSGAWSQDG